VAAKSSILGLDVVASLPLNSGHEEGSDATSVLPDSGDISVVLLKQQVSKNADTGWNGTRKYDGYSP
jgi:hypothetical protein